MGWSPLPETASMCQSGDEIVHLIKRAEVLTFFANLTPCVVGMEACGSAHYWARKLQALGHDVRLIAPQYVKPYVKRNKNDVADSEGICEAVTRPEMPTVPVENEASKRLAEIPGVGPMTASALAASVDDARNFKNGRQLVAWLGLVPRQHSSGGKPTL